MSDDRDDLDDRIRRAMASLDDQVPAGYFDALADRALARVDDPAFAATAVAEAPGPREAPEAIEMGTDDAPVAPVVPLAPARKRHRLIAITAAGVAAAAGATIFVMIADRATAPARDQTVLVSDGTTENERVRVLSPAPRPPLNAPSGAASGAASGAPSGAAQGSATGSASEPPSEPLDSATAGKTAGTIDRKVEPPRTATEPDLAKAPRAPTRPTGKPSPKLNPKLEAAAPGKPMVESPASKTGPVRTKKGGGKVSEDVQGGKTKVERTQLLPKDAMRAIGAVAPRARACLDGTTGAAHVTFTIEPSGKVSKVSLSGFPAPVEACVARVVESAAFPRWDGTAQTFAYSLRSQ